MSKNRFDIFSGELETEQLEIAPPTSQPSAPEAQKPRVSTTVTPAAVSTGRPPKREFDRHSGTGRGKEVSKDGAGRHAWGNQKDPKTELENELGAGNPQDDAEATPGAVEGAEPSTVAAPPPTFTLEEYSKMKAKPEGELFAPIEARKVVATGNEEVLITEEGDLYSGDAKKANKKKKQTEKKVSFTDLYGVSPDPPRRIGEETRPPRRTGDGNDGQRRPYNREPRDRNDEDGQRRPFNRDSGDSNDGQRRPYNRESRDRNEADGQRKPYIRESGDSNDGQRRPYNRESRDRNEEDGQRKPYTRDTRDRNEADGQRKPYSGPRKDGEHDTKFRGPRDVREHPSG